MPITKTHLKQIASEAWSVCSLNIGCCKSYEVKIVGNKTVIKNILDVLADDMNSRDDNRDYICGYDVDEDTYKFFVMELDRRDPCYEFDEEEEDEIVADDAEIYW